MTNWTGTLDNMSDVVESRNLLSLRLVAEERTSEGEPSDRLPVQTWFAAHSAVAYKSLSIATFISVVIISFELPIAI